MPKRKDLNFCFRQEATAEGGKKHMLYIYDNVRKYGKFNWQTWQYEDAETSAKRFRDALDEIPDGDEPGRAKLALGLFDDAFTASADHFFSP